MAKGKGYLAILGIKKATTWGTAVAAGAGDGHEALSVGIVANRAIVPDRSITGKVSTREGDKGNIVVAGSAVFPLRYEGTGRLLAGLLGTAGVPATVDTSARKHTFKIADTTDGIFWTLAYEIIKDATIYEFNTLKIRRLTIRVTIPGRVELEVEFLGHDFTDASAINTTTTIDTVTLPANREIAQARQLVVRMNDQSSGALGPGDVKYLSAFELTIERPLEAEFTTEFGDRSSEPMPPNGEGAFLSASGTLTFSQLDNAATGGNSGLPAKQLARTTQKLDAVFAGDTLVGAATEKVSHKLYLPMIVLGDGKPALSQGALGWSIPFTAHRVGTAPTGFDATYTEPVTWENTNALTGDQLA
jgi:hypothetical protein